MRRTKVSGPCTTAVQTGAPAPTGTRVPSHRRKAKPVGRRPKTCRRMPAAQLVNGLVRRGLVARIRSDRDRREVAVALLPPGEHLLRRLAGQSIAELTTEGPLLVASLRRLIVQSTRGGTPPRTGREGGAR